MSAEHDPFTVEESVDGGDDTLHDFEGVGDDTSVYFEGLAAGPARPTRRRISVMTALLLAAVVAGGGFIAGAKVEKSKKPTTGSGASALAAFLGSRTGQGRNGTGNAGANGGSAFGGGGAGGGGATRGSVKLVDGTTIYVSDSQGNIVKVTTGPNSTITKTSVGTVADIHPGDTVTVVGQAGADGVVAATRVTDGGAAGSGGGGGLGVFGGGSGG